MEVKIIAVGADHAGFPFRMPVIEHLRKKGIDVLDFGTYSAESADYPDFAHPTSNAVESGEAPLGILICGSGNGVNITANKHQGIRAALCWNEELASLARRHNNANILSIPARFISLERALNMIDVFIETEFEGGRHANRVGKIMCI